MAKTWVLDTETKGTGAHVAPLREGSPQTPERDLALVMLERGPHPAAERAPAVKEPPRFKVVDVMTAQVLGERVDTRETVALLERMGSVVDARIYIWSPAAGRWRLLSLEEQKELWRFRGAGAAA